jgi:chromosome segregation and condensation protein ScpB
MKNQDSPPTATSTIPELTETQAKRLAARIRGETLATIAVREGRTRQAISKSLLAPTVRRAAFMILGRPLTIQDEETGEAVDLVCEAVQVVANTMQSATRPVVLTTTADGYTQQRIERFPDYATRLAAASRLLTLVEKPTPTVAIEQEHETVTTHTRQHRRVDTGLTDYQGGAVPPFSSIVT